MAFHLRAKCAVNVTVFALSLALAACDDAKPQPRANPSVEASAMKSNPELFQKVKGEFDQIVEQASSQYHPLVYHFDEDLLTKMDEKEKRLSGAAATASSDAGRLIPEIDAQEEDDHFRETIRRWSQKSSKDFRASLDELTRARAMVDSKQPFHPEFHKQFARVFDDFIAIEVAEMRERRNRSIHERLRKALDPHRNEFPLIVTHFENLVSVPPYQWTASTEANAKSVEK